MKSTVSPFKLSWSSLSQLDKPKLTDSDNLALRPTPRSSPANPIQSEPSPAQLILTSLVSTVIQEILPRGVVNP